MTNSEITWAQLESIAEAMRRRSYPAKRLDTTWKQLTPEDRAWWLRETQGVLLAGKVVTPS